MISLLTYKDLFLTPFYFLVVLFLAFILNSKINKKTPHLRKYFIWGIYIRFFGVVAFGVISSLIYGGDSYHYFIGSSRLIWEAFLENPYRGLSIIFSNPTEIDVDNLPYITRMSIWQGSTAIVRLSGFIGLFTFHTYLPNALFFSLICFSGLWVIYTTILEYYPHLYKQLAFAILFFPSVIYWGSGILKDPITLGALGWAFYSWHKVFIKRENIFISSAILILSIWTISVYKTYVLLCFIPAGCLYIFLYSNSKIKNKATRSVVKPVSIFLAMIISYYSLTQLAMDSEYNLENLAYKSSITYDWIKISSTLNSSVYDIGEMDGSFQSMIKALPQAINAALFRPYLWEVKNAFMLLSALESLFLLFLTINCFYRSGILNILRLINNDPLINFLVIFSLAFAFGAGVSTGNFGTLVRYKIPLIPFYATAIILLRDRLKKSKVTAKSKDFHSRVPLDIASSK